MKTLFFIIMFPCLASAGPYYEVVSSTTVGTATMTVSGYIGVAASSTTPTTYKFRIDGPNGYIQFPDGTKQTSAAAPGNYVLKSGDTMTGQLTLSGSTLTVTGNAFSVGTSTFVVKEGNVGIGLTNPGAKLDVKESGTETYTLVIGTSTTSTYDVVVTTTGNVGIGTTGPSDKLDVSQIIRISGANRNWRLMSHAADGLLYIRDETAEAHRLVINTAGNVGIGTTSPGGGTTVGTKILSLADGTAPAGGVAGQVSLYSSAGELYALDAAGNTTLNSPHDKETGKWIFYSKNTKTGKVLRVDMERLVKFIDGKFGTDFVKEFTIE